MTDKVETPTEITLDIWKDYAARGKVSEIDDALVGKYGLIIPEAFTSAFVSPVGYSEALRKFFVNSYTLGQDKLRDMFVARRVSLGLKDAAEKYKLSDRDRLDNEQFEDGLIMRGFRTISERYVSTGEYYKDCSDPNLFLSMFGPVMEVLPPEKSEKVLNTITNTEDKELIMKTFKESGKEW